MPRTDDPKEQLRLHARLIQRRARASLAIFMTVLFLCVEHVRAFASQYHVTSRDAAVLASAASSLTRKFSSTYLSGDGFKRTLPSGGGAANVFGAVSQRQESSGASSRGVGVGSATRLSMAWSMNLPTISMPTSRELPLHALGSWYSEYDPTTKSPIYDDEYENSYSFTSEDWSSVQAEGSEPKVAQSRIRPFKAIRRVTGRVVNGMANFPRSYDSYYHNP